MSPRPIARSEDLRRLRADGYTLRVVGGRLVIDDVPYVDSQRTVHHDGALVMALDLAGDQTTQPSDHTAHFVGGVPCTKDGAPLNRIINNTNREDLGSGLVASCYFSAKPTANGGRYADFHQKVTTYIGHVAGPALALDPRSTARRYRPVEPDDDADGPFNYLDTASSRAGVDALNERLDTERVGIIGLGGTGEYILDFVAKTRVAEIHPFDRDRFLTHNAFRGPGAPTLDQLNERPLKVEHFGAIYGNMHRGIVTHPYEVTADNVDELRALTFVFISIDDVVAKAPIIAALIEFGIPFIDVGMGIHVVDGRLTGLVRTTLVTPTKNDHASRTIPTVSPDHEGEYRSNIQIAELNGINAALAVLLWKRYRGIVADLDGAHQSLFNPVTNRIANAELVREDPNSDQEAA